ncbi:MAG: acetate--CoA ligase family protein [Alicyclobacillus macrosporangiidus]|uniref:acetate--CoA ligase family protein n=1 Tax=Alicyclobacillus macrosporangiidus TaxID=392015 RepID=UPI0026EAC3DB|nr:acetate--CoA ligase family protein [Alicyclobacillus macrosporangiidus]MCL6600182.1 acetate--CoA ligase family protein [Alicyclobacillus macrosporangiidus]
MSGIPLEKLIRPDSVAVVGASATRGSIGHMTIQNFVDLKFGGRVYAVNPRYQEIEGFPCYPSLSAIPDTVDVVIVAVAAPMVEGVIRECAEKGVKHVIIFSSGFAERDEAGLKMQEEVLSICRTHGIWVLGPNTMGMYNVKDKIVMSFSPLDLGDASTLSTALVSQSGATGGTIMNMGVEEQIGFTYVITTGNQMNLTTIDFLDFLIEDEDTKQIALYMEAVPDGERFIELGRKALRRNKPLTVLKAGRSDVGQKAALSHTASLTGSYQIFELAAKRAGMTVVSELEDLVGAMKAFQPGKLPSGPRVATLVISGAAGILLADEVSELGLQMASLSAHTVGRLAEVVPAYCSLDNPVDIGATYLGNPALYPHCLNTLLNAEEVDMLVVHFPVDPAHGGERLVDDIIEAAARARKPVLVAVVGKEETQGGLRKRLNRHGVPAYSTLKATVQAAKWLWDYAQLQQREAARSGLELVPAKPTASHSQVPGLFTRYAVVTEPEVKRLLGEYGVQVPKGGVGGNIDEIIRIARGLRYPLVAKIVSPEITHKSDVGGVVFPIADELQLRNACESIISRCRAAHPDAQLDGILVEELQTGPFLEFMVSVARDPVFGPVVLCGLGGVYVEVFKDVVRRLAPISKQEALAMLQELNSYPLLTGTRKGVEYDIDALADAVSRLSAAALELGQEWAEIEINPLAVLPHGHGVVALDGLMTRR